jgi:4-amino-4-deoxy-L-arabinose transferase-like glycosyltransferase
MNKTVISRVSPAILLIAALTVLFMGTFDRDLWTPDEPREAAICLEMSRTGDYMIPHLAGQPFIEKPPLYYAVSAGFINALGKYIGNTTALRLVTVMFGIGTLLVTFLLACRLFGPASAMTAAALIDCLDRRVY